MANGPNIFQMLLVYLFKITAKGRHWPLTCKMIQCVQYSMQPINPTFKLYAKFCCILYFNRHNYCTFVLFICVLIIDHCPLIWCDRNTAIHLAQHNCDVIYAAALIGWKLPVPVARQQAPARSPVLYTLRYIKSCAENVTVKQRQAGAAP